MRKLEDIQHTVESTRAYRYVDGLAEIWRGVIFLLLGGAFFFADALGKIYLYGAAVIVALSALALKAVIPRLSERITVDRTGAVRWKPKSVLLRALLVVLAVLAYVVLESLESRPAIPLVLAVAGALILLLLHRWTGLRRFALQAPVMALAGLGALALPMTSGLGLVLTTFGVMWTVGGGFVLRSYLRTDVGGEHSR